MAWAGSSSQTLGVQETNGHEVGNGSMSMSIPKASNGTRKAGRRRKPPPQPRQGICASIMRNQITLSTTCLGFLYAVHTISPSVADPFFQLSYYNPHTHLYSKGYRDVCFVFSWIVMLTFLRASCIDYIFFPAARRGGISTKKALSRFPEQAWLFTYYTTIWALEMYLLYRSPYWMNTRELWRGWPLRETDAISKAYYLIQFAFWTQQIFVIHIEERRKDHNQMFTHHIITCTLIAASYSYHLTRVGHVIMCIMDLADILLPLAKMLKYLGFTWICDVAFFLFLLAWFIARHVIYLGVTYSVAGEASEIIGRGSFSLSRAKISSSEWGASVCFSAALQSAFVGLLLTLQLLTLVWFWMILKVAVKVVRGGTAEDSRSDDEDEVEEGDQDDEAGANTSLARKRR